AELDVDTLVSACPWSERPLSEAGDAQDIDVVDLHELFAQSLGITVGGSPGGVGDRRLAQAPTRAGGAAAAAWAAAAAGGTDDERAARWTDGRRAAHAAPRRRPSRHPG